MTVDQWLVVAILIGALVLFVTEKLRVDLVALLVLVTIILTGLLTPEEAFAGFASPAVITVWAVFIISGALFHSGVADTLTQVNVLIFGAGGYKFSDYARVGVWLNLIILGLVALFLPLIWPLYP